MVRVYYQVEKMTALNIGTDIPSQIDTLEKLAVWVGLSLQHINGTAEVVEGQGYSERAAQFGVFYVGEAGVFRALIRESIEMSKDWQTGSQKPWQYAQPLSNSPIPAGFKAN